MRATTPELMAAGALMCLAWSASPRAEGGSDGALDGLDPELRACAERALPRRTMVQQQTVKVVGDSGWERESSRTVYWKRDDDGTMKVLFRVDRPVAEQGLKVLVVRREDSDPVLYVYTPDTGRARRIVGSGASNSVLGTDLTYEDALHFENFLRADTTRRVADVDLDGHPAFVVETVPDGDASAYSLIRTFVDQVRCIPARAEFYGMNGSLHKTLLAERDAVEMRQGRWIPMRTVMLNHAQRSRSEFTVTDVEIDVELPDHLFTLAEIRRSR